MKKELEKILDNAGIVPQRKGWFVMWDNKNGYPDDKCFNDKDQAIDFYNNLDYVNFKSIGYDDKTGSHIFASWDYEKELNKKMMLEGLAILAENEKVKELPDYYTFEELTDCD